MGIISWAAVGALAFLVARIIPAGRTSGWSIELVGGLVSAFAFGALATALDFGGWGVFDWRAALFVFLGALAASGLARAYVLARSR